MIGGHRGASGHKFRTFGADGRNTDAFSEETRRQSGDAPRLPRSHVGKALFAAAVIALLVVFALVF